MTYADPLFIKKQQMFEQTYQIVMKINNDRI
jgi:hypothetical protein